MRYTPLIYSGLSAYAVANVANNDQLEMLHQGYGQRWNILDSH